MKIKDLKDDTPERKMAKENCIFFCRTGSHMYGTNTPESDDDFVGIFIEDIDYLLTHNKRIEQVEFRTNPASSGKRNSKDDTDITIYSLTKWIKLAAGNNPNILELFFAPENCILHMTEEGKKLMDSYEMFVSQKAYHSFRGYSHDQMHKLKTKKKNDSGRVELVDKFGFDTKLALHNLRLFLECFQLLKSGRIEFPLAENRMLLDIKRGRWSEEEFFKKSEELNSMVVAALTTSTIRYAPNHEAIGQLQKELLLNWWGLEEKKHG